MIPRKIQVITDHGGNIIATGPAKLSKDKEGPRGVFLEPLIDQEKHDISLPKTLQNISFKEFFVRCQVKRPGESKLVIAQLPNSEKKKGDK